MKTITKQDVITLINDQDLCKLKAFEQTLSYVPESLGNEEMESLLLIKQYLLCRKNAEIRIEEEAKDLTDFGVISFEDDIFEVTAEVHVKHVVSKGDGWFIPDDVISEVKILNLKITTEIF